MSESGEVVSGREREGDKGRTYEPACEVDSERPFMLPERKVRERVQADPSWVVVRARQRHFVYSCACLSSLVVWRVGLRESLALMGATATA